MRSAAGLTLLAAGAILTFAVTAQVPGINLRAAGVILIVTGIVALIPPAWFAALLHRGRPAGQQPAGPPAPGADGAGEPDESVYPAYLLQDPAVLAAEVLNGARAARTGASASPRALRPVGRDGQDGDA